MYIKEAGNQGKVSIKQNKKKKQKVVKKIDRRRDKEREWGGGEAEARVATTGLKRKFRISV